MKKWSGHIIPVLLLYLCLPGCATDDEPGDPVLASVYNYTLHLSDAEDVIAGYESPQDSIAQLRHYVERWVRETLLLHEAERNLPKDVNLDALISDYRASLLVSNYEKTLIESRLDTIISDAELEAYYERNKEQYQLERPIVRCHFIKVKKPVMNRDQLRRWWDSEKPADLRRLIAYGNRHEGVFMLEDSTWYKVEEIENLMPPGTLSTQNMRRNRSLRFTDDQYEYYLRIHESVLSTEIAPLSYIREQASRYIMHKRKLELLEKIKADLYSTELESDQVKIHL